MDTTTRNLSENSPFNMPELNLNNYITYTCATCGQDNDKKPIDDINCHYCSGKIMLKKRNKAGIQYEAR